MRFTSEEVSVWCAVISTAMAILQFVAAGLSLWAAWKIAGDQRAEAERAKRAAGVNFVAVVASLAEEALREADKADTALRAGAGVSGILANFTQRLADLHEALQPIRAASPADAALMLAVGRLSRVLIVTVGDAYDTPMAIQLVGRHQGSIGIELGKIRPLPPPEIVVEGLDGSAL